MKKLIVAACALSLSGLAAAQQSVEVLHWWTSGGEAAALNVLKGNLEKQGVKWNDMPVAGGGGEAAMTAVRARVTSGNPPTAVQMLGFDILDWAKQGVLADLNAVAAKKAGTRRCRPRCRNSPSTTASGSPRRSTSTRPTGSGPTRKCWPRPASRRCRPTSTSSSPTPRRCRRPASSASPTAASPGRTRPCSTASCSPPAASTSTRRPSFRRTRPRSARRRC